MTSTILPVIGLAISIALAVFVAALCVAAGYAIWQLRRVVPKRIKVLEDALRVYNSANASLGCRITELETTLQQLRAHPVEKPIRTESACVRIVETAPARIVETAAARYGTAPAPAASKPQSQSQSQSQPQLQPQPQPARTARPHGSQAGGGGEFTEAELRLAQLIKSRLSSLRVG